MASDAICISMHLCALFFKNLLSNCLTENKTFLITKLNMVPIQTISNGNFLTKTWYVSFLLYLVLFDVVLLVFGWVFLINKSAALLFVFFVIGVQKADVWDLFFFSF